MLRTAIAATLIVGALSLAGCAGNPDLSSLESELSDVEGVNGAMAWPTHSGAPWNTQINVLLFVDDPSDEGLIDAVRAAAPVLAADSVASRNEVTIGFVDGDRDDYSERSEAFGDELVVMEIVPQTLGVRDSGRAMLVLSPDEVRALAQAQ